MNVRWGLAYAGLACLVISVKANAEGSQRPASVRVLAGIRDYPEEAVEALASLSRLPEWIDRAAERLRKSEPVPWDEPDMPSFVRDALTRLAFTPEAVLVASQRREELARLRHLREDSTGTSVRQTQELREAFTAARSAGADAWQRALERDSAAQEAYRDLLTQFCKAERERNPHFACVQVTDRNYYLACPPDGAVMAYAQQLPPQAALKSALENWWRNHGTDAVDHRVLTRRASGRSPAADRSLWNESQSSRRSMWLTDTGVPDDSAGLVPLLLQPPGDQPEEARLASAAMEHMRLWSQPDAVAPPPPAYREPQVAERSPPPPLPVPAPAPTVPSGPRPRAERQPTVSAPDQAPPPPYPAYRLQRPQQRQSTRIHEALRPNAPVVREYRQPQYEQVPRIKDGVRYRSRSVQVTVEQPARVRTHVYAYTRPDWDDDDIEDWAEAMEDRTGIDDDWWEDHVRRHEFWREDVDCRPILAPPAVFLDYGAWCD